MTLIQIRLHVINCADPFSDHTAGSLKQIQESSGKHFTGASAAPLTNTRKQDGWMKKGLSGTVSKTECCCHLPSARRRKQQLTNTFHQTDSSLFITFKKTIHMFKDTHTHPTYTKQTKIHLIHRQGSDVSSAVTSRRTQLIPELIFQLHLTRETDIFFKVPFICVSNICPLLGSETSARTHTLSKSFPEFLSLSSPC